MLLALSSRIRILLPYATGVVVALDTNFKGLFRLHAGGEVIGPFVGIESGPSLVRDAGRWRLGLGSTVWAGFDVIPYSCSAASGTSTRSGPT